MEVARKGRLLVMAWVSNSALVGARGGRDERRLSFRQVSARTVRFHAAARHALRAPAKIAASLREG
jgi:hypothetical protein